MRRTKKWTVFSGESATESNIWFRAEGHEPISKGQRSGNGGGN